MRPIPTISNLYNQISTDLRSRLGISNLILKSVLKAISSVLAAQFKLIYLFLSDIQNNVFPDTADTEANGGTLERIGRIQIGRNPRPATVGVINISVNGLVGSTLRTSITIKSNDDAKNPSKLFIITAPYTLAIGSNIVQFRALESGLGSSLLVGDKLTFTEPIIGVDKTVEVASIVSEPLEAESIEVYRQAIIDSIQLEPQGGSKTDYRLWASDAQGVFKVYPYVKESNAGIVQIFVEATPENSTDGKGTPSQTILDNVEDVLELDPDTTKPIHERGRRPIQSVLEVLPVTLIPVDIDINQLNDQSQNVKALIENTAKNYLKNIRPYISGADLVSSKNDILLQARLQSEIISAISTSNFFENLAMKVNGVSVNNYAFNLGNIPYLRTINYV